VLCDSGAGALIPALCLPSGLLELHDHVEPGVLPVDDRGLADELEPGALVQRDQELLADEGRALGAGGVLHVLEVAAGAW
jgi:hypothetical protein